MGLIQTVSLAASGTASTFVPIVPCRLVDTRPAPNNVGTLALPLRAAEVVTFAVWGTNGNCTIPTSATGIATNATAVNPTSDSYITIYPADANPRPTASNLNVVSGGAPTPNQVTVGLSAIGTISAYNNGGTLDLVIDIVGYYQPASVGLGAAGPQGPQGVQGPPGPTCPTSGCSLMVSGTSSVADEGDLSTTGVDLFGCRTMRSTIAYLPIELPVGAKITAASVRYKDVGAAANISFDLFYVTDPGSTRVNMTLGSLVTVDNHVSGDLVFTTTPPPVGPLAAPYIMATANGAAPKFCGATITYNF